jgi:hypothetical protein
VPLKTLFPAQGCPAFRSSSVLCNNALGFLPGNT